MFYQDMVLKDTMQDMVHVVGLLPGFDLPHSACLIPAA